MENENLNNKLNVKKSNLRNYDENPIIMKDYGISVNIFSVIICIILTLIYYLAMENINFRKEILLFGLYFPIFKFIFDGYSKRKGSYYYFENSKIIHAKNKFNPIQEINLDNIANFTKTTYAISPYDNKEIKVNKNIIFVALVFAAFIYIVNFFIDPNLFFKFLIVIGIIVAIIFLPTILFQIFLGDFSSLRIYDTLEIRTKNNEMMKIYIPTQSEYNEIRKYFIYKTGKDIKKVSKFKKII